MHRRRFTLGRAALRRVLARYLAERPERLEFRTSDHGKPFLPASVSDGLRFNSSDSEDLSLIAVTRDREVGIDIERIEPSRAGLDIAERFFSPDEFHRLEALPDALRVPAFFACWTRKEAYLKAIGTGLLVPLDSFSVAFEPGRPAELLSVDEDPAAAARWSLLDLGAGDGYAAALAIEDRTPVLRCWSWPPPDAGSP